MAKPLYRLYLIHMTGCETCTVVKPIVEAWAAKHPGIRFIPFDYATQEWKADKWYPEKVPALILLNPMGKYTHWEAGDVTKEDDVSAWLARVDKEALRVAKGGA